MGNTTGSACLRTTATTMNTIMMTKDDAEDGKGSRGGVDDGGNPTMTVTMSLAGHLLGMWGRGR